MAVFPTGHVKQRTAYALVLPYWRASSPNRRRVLLYKCRFITMNSDAVILLETVNFAAEKHRNQRRKDTEQTPYINHPVGRKCFCDTFSWCVQGHSKSSEQSRIQNREDFWDTFLHFTNAFWARLKYLSFLLQWLVIFLMFLCVLIKLSKVKWFEKSWVFSVFLFDSEPHDPPVKEWKMFENHLFNLINR